jgi:hypothetical protein
MIDWYAKPCTVLNLAAFNNYIMLKKLVGAGAEAYPAASSPSMDKKSIKTYFS